MLDDWCRFEECDAFIKRCIVSDLDYFYLCNQISADIKVGDRDRHNFEN
jgi:hypothetical protein